MVSGKDFPGRYKEVATPKKPGIEYDRIGRPYNISGMVEDEETEAERARVVQEIVDRIQREWLPVESSQGGPALPQQSALDKNRMIQELQLQLFNRNPANQYGMQLYKSMTDKTPPPEPYSMQRGNAPVRRQPGHIGNNRPIPEQSEPVDDEDGNEYEWLMQIFNMLNNVSNAGNMGRTSSPFGDYGFR